MIKIKSGFLILFHLVFFGAGVGGCAPDRTLPEQGGADVSVDAGAADPLTTSSPGVGGDSGSESLFADSESYGEGDDIYQHYGELRVWPGEVSGESAVKPWSGYWLPARSRFLFEGSRSPLALWDQFVKGSPLSRPVIEGAVSWEKAQHEQNPQALSWEGACDAWAVASLYENEPQLPVRVGPELSLSVGVQKALLVRSWDWVEGKRVYGRPYRGDRESKWDEPSPAAFHRFMQAELFEQGRPFIVDKDPGIPVWNTPVHAAISELRDDPADPNSMLVRTWLKGVDPLFKNPDDTKTYIIWVELAYRLKGVRKSDGSLLVLGGAWIKDENSGVDSTQFHPDFLVGLPSQGVVPAHGSFNPGMDPTDWLEYRARLGLSYRTP